MAFGAGREKTDVRRRQIVQAALALLGDSPLDQLSTRQIARALGISQPALFRHFASREALLLGVIAETRLELGALAEGVLASQLGPVARLEALAVRLLDHLERHPGLPRLLFANVASGGGPVRTALQQLYSMQSSLVTELVREGQRAGEIDASVDARDAATLFIGLLQSVTLLRRLQVREGSLQDEGRRLLAIWKRGVSSRMNGAAAPRPKAELAKPDGIRVLDVRPLLARGTDPLDAILDSLAQVGPSGVLSVTAPFRPAPLIALLRGRGHAVVERQLGPRHFHVEIIHGGEPVPLDLTDLEPPAPLERVLEECERLRSGGVLLARLPRHPRMLLPHLRERGLVFGVIDQPDGRALLRVYKP
jgi:AcrR family transcriptional regulator/uncharacterized protein (DUF2249 family)